MMFNFIAFTNNYKISAFHFGCFINVYSNMEIKIINKERERERSRTVGMNGKLFKK